jgi:hypothetical protein
LPPVEVKERPRPRWRIEPPTAALLVLVMLSALTTAWLMLPRAVPMVEPPSLTLERTEARRVHDHDRSLAEAAPRSEATKALERLIREQNLAEVGPGEPAGTFDARRQEVARAVERVRADHGADGLEALRAVAVEGLDRTMDGGVALGEQDALLGSFPRVGARYGLWHDGYRVAPRFVVRTLFKARWNALVGLAPTERLAPAEELAYWGWLALHAPVADVSRREEALRRYGALGGKGVHEAQAWMAHRAGRPAEAARWMALAQEASGGVRLRNHTLWLMAAVE